MKLRNKKTGEVVNAMFYAPIGCYELNIWKDSDYFDPTADSQRLGYYTTLAELNEEWEDYKPAEPLIKDEKICKAVRAWASSNEVKEVLFDEYWHSFRDADMVISFLFSYRDFDCLEDGKTYTIAELCGEEEE